MAPTHGSGGPLRLDFATWGEAVVHLRSRLASRTGPVTPDELGELLARQVGSGSARRWTAWLRGQRDGANGICAAGGLAAMAKLFIERWPSALADARPPPPEGKLVERIAAALARLPVHSPDQNPEPASGASLQTLVRAHLDDHQLRHSDLAERLSAVVREQPLLAELAGGDPEPIRQWHVQRIASGKGLDGESATYYLFVRAFAALRGDPAGRYFQLPFRSAESQLGVFLRARLSTSGEDQGAAVDPAAVEAFEKMAGDILERVVRPRVMRAPDRYRPYAPLEVEEAGGGVFGLSLRLRPLLGPPTSSAYAPALLLLVEFARQLRVAWSLHEVTLALLRSGAPAFEPVFVLHAGLRPVLERISLDDVPWRGSRIAFSSDAYYHARAADLRISWAEPTTAGPRSGDRPSEFRTVLAFQSHIYYGAIETFGDDVAAREPGLLAELAPPNPLDVFAGIELAVWLFQRRRFLDAIRVARGVLAIEGRHPTAWSVIALSYGNLARAYSAPEGNPLAAFDTVARYHHRAIAAARLGIEADPLQEDAHVLCGCLHVLRALDGVRWYDRALVRALSPFPDAVRTILAVCGVAWAAGADAPRDVRALLRRAALDDLVEARRQFDLGVEVSPTKSRSLFWRLLADALLCLAARAAPDTPGAPVSLAAGLAEIGWLQPSAGDAAVAALLGTKIDEYDACLLLEAYRPEVHFAYAVVHWDFIGPTAASAQQVRRHLAAALDLSAALPSREDRPPFIMRCWGYLQTRVEFEQHVHAALAQIEHWERDGVYVPLHPLYVGEAISRSFAEFLATVVAPGASQRPVTTEARSTAAIAPSA